MSQAIDRIDGRRRELVSMLHPHLLEVSSPTADRINKLTKIHAQTAALFPDSNMLTTQKAQDIAAVQRQLLDLTYADLQHIALPYYVGLTELAGYLQSAGSDKITYNYRSIHSFPDRHLGTVLPSNDPNQLWFIDLGVGKKRILNRDSTDQPKNIWLRLRELLHLPSTINVNMVKYASFILADKSNLSNLVTKGRRGEYGFFIRAGVYGDQGLGTARIQTVQSIFEVSEAIGIKFDRPGVARAVISYPDGLGVDEVASYRLNRFCSKATAIYTMALASDFGYCSEYRLFDYRESGGYFRRNTYDQDEPTVQDEVATILSRLPAIQTPLDN